jgi:hypothetical protein
MAIGSLSLNAILSSKAIAIGLKCLWMLRGSKVAVRSKGAAPIVRDFERNNVPGGAE